MQNIYLELDWLNKPDDDLNKIIKDIKQNKLSHKSLVELNKYFLNFSNSQIIFNYLKKLNKNTKLLQEYDLQQLDLVFQLLRHEPSAVTKVLSAREILLEELQKQNDAACKLEAIQRGKLARKDVQDQHDAACKLEAIQRGKKAREAIDEQREAAVAVVAPGGGKRRPARSRQTQRPRQTRTNTVRGMASERV